MLWFYDKHLTIPISISQLSDFISNMTNELFMTFSPNHKGLKTRVLFSSKICIMMVITRKIALITDNDFPTYSVHMRVAYFISGHSLWTKHKNLWMNDGQKKNMLPSSGWNINSNSFSCTKHIYYVRCFYYSTLSSWFFIWGEFFVSVSWQTTKVSALSLE